VACSSCLSVSLPSCPAQLILNAGLIANTKYRWEIKDKHNIVYNGVTTTDATGLLQISVADNPDIPKGLFMSFSGSFILKVYVWVSDYQVQNAQFFIASTTYDCAELMFKNYMPSVSYFDPDAPVYIPPIIEPIAVEFTDQTTVTVTHNLGYHPFIFIEDDDGNIIGGNVQHTDNNEFVVSFDSSTSGTIYYK